jgi:Tfp pilus assembly protein PilO
MARLIIAVISFVAAGAIFFLYTQPTYDTVQTEQAQIAQYDAALDKATQLQTLKQTLLSRYNAFDTNSLDRLQKLLPDHVDNIALILDLDSIASRYGLMLQNVDVSNSGGQAAMGQAAIGAIGASNQAYDSLSLTFTTQGTYSNFLQFLTELETSLRIVDLASLTISPASSNTTTGVKPAEPVYNYNITLRTYWLK